LTLLPYFNKNQPLYRYEPQTIVLQNYHLKKNSTIELTRQYRYSISVDYKLFKNQQSKKEFSNAAIGFFLLK
jgi:hypothetical protein